MNEPVSKKKGQAPDKQRLPFALDGEDLSFLDFVKFETVANGIDILVDYDYMMKEEKHFIQKEHQHSNQK